MKYVDKLLAERRVTHGDFSVNAAVSQALKRVLMPMLTGSDDVVKEAAEQICLKLSRVACGGTPDNWADIAGYATLAQRHLEGAQ